MTRTEIILNRAVEEDLLEELHEANAAARHTRIPGVHGVGSSGERRGDHVWPEENVLFLVYGDQQSAQKIFSAVQKLKARFPNEGIRLFQYEVDVTEI